jgi:hypothetical protein
MHRNNASKQTQEIKMKPTLQALSILVLATIFATTSASAVTSVSDDASLDLSMRSIDEVQSLEQSILGTAPNTVGPLTNMAICIQVSITTNAISAQMEKIVETSALDAFKQVPFGAKLLKALREEDPTVFRIRLENRPYAQACEKEIAHVRSDRRIDDLSFQKSIKLGEISGAAMASFMTSGLE